MIAANVAGSSAGTATRASGSASDAAPGNPADDSGFAGLLASPSATPAAKPASSAPAVKESGTGAEAEDDAAADTPGHPMLPEQLLALIAASPATSAAARGALAAAPSAAAAALATQTAAVTFAISGTAVAGSATALAPVPTAGTVSDPAGSLAAPVGLTAVPAAATDTNHAPAIPLADFAKALGLAAADAATSTSSDPTVPDIGDRSSLLAPTTSSAVAPARAPAAVAAPLALPAHPDAGFDDAFGARIGWLADQRIGRAEIRLNPEHLGAIDVRLQIDGTRVTAEFHSAHADVRHALENSVGRLREMLGQQGLQLAQADVGQGRSGGHGERSSPTRDADSLLEHDAHMITRPTVQPLHSRGLLDEYA